jgi:diguanylate cyclase (GGDEF)-like protein
VQIDPPTLILYTAALLAVIGCLFAFFWSREKQRASLVWFVLPFVLGVVGATMALNPASKVGDWGTKFGTVFILLAYGFAWQMVRVFYHRRPVLLFVFAPTILWFVLSATVIREWELFVISAMIRTAVMATFTGLCAYEFWRSREQDDPPSRRILFGVFAAYCLFYVVRIPIMPIVPMPIGMAPTAIWSIIVYNFATVLLVLLVSIFMIALSRERSSARNYSLAMQDAMTQVYNRRAYHEQMQTLAPNGNDPIRPYALLALDIDSFKSINDRFGHPMGDKAIILAAQAAVATLRKDDRVFRIGGEEFACLLLDTSLEQAYEAAERVRAAFQKIGATIDGEQIDATISIGVAATDGQLSADQVFAQADAALYQAKRSGRNQTVMAGADETDRQLLTKAAPGSVHREAPRAAADR